MNIAPRCSADSGQPADKFFLIQGFLRFGTYRQYLSKWKTTPWKKAQNLRKVALVPVC